uniref:Immunoglobulin superfamily member 10 n=1 Tax=Cyanoderma ruficeps TaxID=181631 RepID=A0A8C3QJC8_9PASS
IWDWDKEEAVGYLGGTGWAVLPNGTLSIRRAGPQHGGQYLCTAASPLGAPPRIAGGRPLTAHSGDTAALPCRARGSPAPSISWLLPNGTRLSRSAAGSGRAGVRPDGTLLIRAVSVYDRGLYTCLAENPAGTDSLAVKLQVVAAPPTVLEEKRQSVAGTAGDSLELPCTVRGKPEPSVHWVLPDGTAVRPLQTVRPGVLVFPNGTLLLGGAAPSDSGSYECIATSSTGDDTKLYRLDVAAKPPTINGLHRNKTIMKVTAVRHSKKHIDCRAEGTPPPQIMWIMPDNIFLTAPYYGSRIVVHKNGTLEIRNIRPSDTGDFICVARNDGGESVLVVSGGICWHWFSPC